MNLHRFLMYLLLALSFPALGQTRSYQLEGTVNIPELKRVYLFVGSFQGPSMSDPIEIAVKNGQFLYKGTIAEPLPAFLSTVKPLQANTDQALQFILDSGQITIAVKDKLSSARVSGSKAHDDFQKFNSGQAQFNQIFSTLNTQAQAESQKGMSPDAIQEKYAPLFKAAQVELGNFQEFFIRQNPKAYISLLLVSEYGRLTEDFIKAEALLRGLDASLQSGKTGVSIRDYIAKEKKTSVGALAPDFSLADSTGKKIPLSSLKGKYVLLDFWAAWCGPCRQENPNVVQAYKTYKDKGFTVFGVSLDRDRKSWLKAIKADELTWNHVSDLKYWGSEAAVLYGINAIPRNFLLDPQGKIIARDLRGPALLTRLAEIFK